MAVHQNTQTTQKHVEHQYSTDLHVWPMIVSKTSTNSSVELVYSPFLHTQGIAAQSRLNHLEIVVKTQTPRHAMNVTSDCKSD